MDIKTDHQPESKTLLVVMNEINEILMAFQTEKIRYAGAESHIKRILEQAVLAERARCLRCLGEEKQYQRKTNSLALHRSDDYVDGSNDRLIIAREKIEGGKEV